MRIAVSSFPAFLFAGIRNTTAGLLLLLSLSFTSIKYDWSLRNIGINFLSGTLIVCLGNGLLTWAVKFIPSGLASLICTLIPFNIVMISLLGGKGNRINSLIIVGSVSGLLGMAFIFRDNIKDLSRPEYTLGVLVAFIATLCWSAGTVFSRIMTAGTNPVYNAGLQLFSGGLVAFVISLFTGDWHHLGPISNESLFALFYLTILGSAAAFVAYQYALSSLPLGLVAVYAYINPLIAVVLGYFILSERLTAITGLAFLLTIGGVYFVNRGYNKLKTY
jgi:drug/metabolite transporter (DMT)-like permease